MADLEIEKFRIDKESPLAERDSLTHASDAEKKAKKATPAAVTKYDMESMHEAYEEGSLESRLDSQKENDRLTELLRKNIEQSNRDEILEVVSNIGNISVPNEQLIDQFVKKTIIEFFSNSSSAFLFLSALLKDRRNIERVYASDNNGLHDLIERIIPDLEQEKLKQLTKNQAENYMYLVAKFPIAKNHYGDIYPFIQSKSNLLKPLLREFPESANVLERIKIDEMNEYDVVRILLEKDIFDFRSDEAKAVSNSCKIRKIALNIFQKLPKEKQDKLIPLFVDHFLDTDFGDLNEAREFISSVGDENVKRKLLDNLPEALDATGRTPEKIRNKWHQKTQENKERIQGKIIEDHSQEAENIVNSIKENVFFSINMSIPAIIDLLQKKSLLSNWEIGNSRYLPNIFSLSDKKAAKDETEKYLGIRGKGSQKDPHPIYGAVGYCNGIEENTGAVNLPHYGSCHIKIDPAFAKSTAIFFYGDSMTANLQELNSGNSEEFEKKILDLDGAILGKALLELDPEEKERNLYIETILTQGVKMENIVEIVIPKSELEHEGISIESLREKAQGVKITLISK